MDDEYANRTWQTLHDAIQEIHRQNASGLSFEELYRNAYNMVLHKFGDRLYNGLVDTITQHLREVAAEIQQASDEEFLLVLKDKWVKHKLSSIMIRDILMYMDRTYVPQHRKVPVYDRGLLIFRDEVCRHPRIKERLLSMLLDLIRRERSGEMIERGLVKTATEMLVELSREVYQQDFEQPFLQATADFYASESSEYICQNSASDYMRKAEQRLAEENERVSHYLDASTDAKLREVSERELIAKHMRTLAEMAHSGVVSMLENERAADLKRAYGLFRRVKVPTDGLSMMREIMAKHIKGLGEKLVRDEELGKQPVLYVEKLLQLRDKYARVIEGAFDGDKQFYNTLNQSFEFFFNLNQRSPEYISLFVDEHMRKGVRSTSDEEVDTLLDKVVMLFRYLQEKDVFEKYYKQHLAKRLLGGRSASDDIEGLMIRKLKQECGYQFTSKLEGMFLDMKMSADTQQTFRDAHEGSSRVGDVELAVHVLTTGFWPTQAAAACALPEPINKCIDVFTKHYLKQHSNRRLTWQPNIGNAELKATFSGRRHEINVSTYQMCVLLLFNAADCISYADIATATKIPPPDLKRALQSLACGKFRILTKEPKGRDVDEGDAFHFNAGFTSKQLKFKVGTVSAQRESEAEKLETRQKVDEDRKPQIEAAIVRTMKSRKEMEHNALIAEVTSQLMSRFAVGPHVIKKRIESLIEREFMEREKSNYKMYKYLA